MSELSITDWALRYASIGWKVFPVNINKEPLTTNGFKDATDNTEQIRNWWKKTPSAGIGVATGAVSGIIVLDADMNKEGAEQSLRTMVESKGPFSQAVVSKTGGGGYHFFFRHPGENVSNAQTLFGLTGIDVRGDGGYVVVPPSAHASGNRYVWGDDQSPFDTSMDPCPEYLYRNRLAPRNSLVQFAGPIYEGERNATLTAIAGLLRALGLNYDEMLVVLISQNQTRCVPPLPETEVENIVRHVERYPPHNNRGAQDDANTPGREELLNFERSDTGFGNMLAFINLGRLKYNHTFGRWLLWREHNWEYDEKEEALLRAIDATLMYRRACELITEDENRDAAISYSLKIQAKARLDAGLMIARAQPSISTVHGDWNANPDIFAVNNGVIELRTGEMRPGKPDDLISSASPVKYDSSASAPRWLQFLSEVFQNDHDVIRFVQKAVGYSLTGRISEQCLFIMVGGGANGKSTFLEILHSVLGPYSYSAPFSTFERTQTPSSVSNDIAALAGRRMVTASEPNEGVVLSESRIKSMTGGDTISARFLHQEFFEFRPTFKIWLGVNHLPRVVDDSDGFWRRVRKIDFPVKFHSVEEAAGRDVPLKDVSLTAKLMAEAPGILNWALEGASLWYREGLNIPEKVIEATQTYRTDSDPLHDFITFALDKNPDVSEPADILFRAYVAYCQARMLKSFEILSSTRFHNRIKSQFDRAVENGSGKEYRGIQLKDSIRGELTKSDNVISIRRIVNNGNVSKTETA